MIEKYNNKYKNEIVKIAYDIWSGEIECSERVENLLYKFLIEYYLVDNDLTFVDKDDKVVGFALAAERDFHTNASDNIRKLSNDFTKEEKDDIEDYIKYIESNSLKVKSIMGSDDVYFGLLASIKKGSGRTLIENLKHESKAQGYKNIYFWTDETCDYEYYEKHGFNKIDEYMIDLFGKPIKTFIYKIEL